MYTKSTMFVTHDDKCLHRSGHTKRVISLPKGTKKIYHYVMDGSGRGRGGESSLVITPKTTDADLIANARKA
jgi:hypothetical protein